MAGVRHRATSREWGVLRETILRRDKSCIATDRDKVGDAVSSERCLYRFGDWEAEHVQYQAAMGLKAPDVIEHLVVLCWAHHQGGWATANRPAERDYLARLYPAHWASEPCTGPA